MGLAEYPLYSASTISFTQLATTVITALKTFADISPHIAGVVDPVDCLELLTVLHLQHFACTIAHLVETTTISDLSTVVHGSTFASVSGEGGVGDQRCQTQR